MKTFKKYCVNFTRLERRRKIRRSGSKSVENVRWKEKVNNEWIVVVNMTIESHK